MRLVKSSGPRALVRPSLEMACKFSSSKGVLQIASFSASVIIGVGGE
jgi:hypothetical protein